MTDFLRQPFARKELVDEPGILGAQWWHEGLVHDEATGRRNLILGLLAGAGLIVGVSLLIDQATKDDGVNVRTEDRRSLDMQKAYGWNFGATDVPLVFEPTSIPVPTTAWATIVRDMQPDAVHLIPFFVPTLFQSPLAVPELPRLPDEPTYQTLAVAMKGLAPTAGTIAKARGAAFARVCALMPEPPNGVAVIVDLPGPDAVAFAAGAASLFTPIFAIDNWPHPRGVVPAHLTLAAIADHHDDLMDAATTRNQRPTPGAPMMVLDRNRLASYVDSASQFDNRHVARLPTAANLKSLGVSYVLYICPLGASIADLDDLNDDLVEYAAAGLTVRALGVDAFAPSMVPSIYRYGGPDAPDDSFWADYPWSAAHVDATLVSKVSPGGKTFVPKRRPTAFSAMQNGSAVRVAPASFATVPVMLAVATGVVIGAQMNRSGSWNRSGSTSWSGAEIVQLSIFALEVCLALDESPSHRNLRGLMGSLDERMSVTDKWQFYQDLSRELQKSIGSLRRGCWDYFDNDERARRDYQGWADTLQEHTGAPRETDPAEAGDPYRAPSHAYFFTVTTAFLLVKDSDCDTEIRSLLEIPESDLWKRLTFLRVLKAMGTLNFASVESDTVYLIPRDAERALTEENLASPVFDYLRAVT